MVQTDRNICFNSKIYTIFIRLNPSTVYVNISRVSYIKNYFKKFQKLLTTIMKNYLETFIKQKDF